MEKRDAQELANVLGQAYEIEFRVAWHKVYGSILVWEGNITEFPSMPLLRLLDGEIVIIEKN